MGISSAGSAPSFTKSITHAQLAVCYHVATVCVKPYHVTLAKEDLKDSDVIASRVVGFPRGITAIFTFGNYTFIH